MTTETPPPFGALLRQFRRSAELSQEALAERAGLSVRAIRALEGGERRAPYPHTVGQLARALRLAATDRARLAAAVPPRHGPPGSAAADPDPATSLPSPLTSFVGRERELAEVRRLLSETRLLTLTGAGGVGKTRLALEAARAVQADYRDGVRLVELAPLTDGGLAPQAVAQALGMGEQSGRAPTAALAAWLADKRLLLVLDNCEHLVEASARLADALLVACPQLRVLATSREPLRVGGELAWRVPSLALPDPARPAAPAELARSEAVRLFAARAGFARPGFAVTPANAAAVAEVCRRLDGIPLALELAAARLGAFTVEQLAARLDDRFPLLTGGSRAALPRQQTLEATIDWSYDLLSAPEQGVFRRLAVFAGGWTLAAAEAVGADEGIEARAVLEVLGRLVDKSLVQFEEVGAGEGRYRLLEMVRQYAGERLAEAGEETTARTRHRDWCLTLAERAEPALQTAEQAGWLARLDLEHDNLRAALTWNLERDPPAALPLANCLWQFWSFRGYFTEGLDWLERALTWAPEWTERRVQGLLGRTHLARLQSNHAAARAGGEEALSRSRELGDTRLIAWSLVELGAVGFWSGDHRQARAWLEEALPLVRSTHDPRGLGNILYFLGRLLAVAGDYGQADALLRECLALHRAGGRLDLASLYGGALRELGWIALCQGEIEQAQALVEEALTRAERAGLPTGSAMAREYLAWIAYWQGDLERASRQFEATLAVVREADYIHGIAAALVGLGQVTQHQGEVARARAHLEEALALYQGMAHKGGCGAARRGLGLAAWSEGHGAVATARLQESLTLRHELGERLGIAECLEGLALVAAGTGQYSVGARRAARLLGAAEALRQAIGAPLPLVDRPTYQTTLRAIRTGLRQATFQAAWAEGQALTLEEAVAEALAEEASPP